MPGPGPTLTQLAQNVGEGVKASKILLEKLAQTNLFDCNLSFKPKSKLFSGSFLRPKHFPSPDNLPLTCRHSWTFMSLDLEPLVAEIPHENSDAAATDATGAADGVNRNDAGRPEDPPQPAAPASRRRRLVDVSEGQVVSRHCMKQSRNY